VRTLALIRETLARHDGLADFAFAMQGLGAGAITLFGTAEQREWLERTRSGEAIAAFALTEPRSGSDVAAMETSAVRGRRRLGTERREDLDLERRHRRSLLRLRPDRRGAGGARAVGLRGAGDAPGLRVVERLETIAPHPLARLAFEDLRLPGSALIGRPGEGFKIAMSVLDVFRTTVGRRRSASRGGRSTRR
jgi:acyl-CoA dehydrogenase